MSSNWDIKRSRLESPGSQVPTGNLRIDFLGFHPGDYQPAQRFKIWHKSYSDLPFFFQKRINCIWSLIHETNGVLLYAHCQKRLVFSVPAGHAEQGVSTNPPEQDPGVPPGQATALPQRKTCSIHFGQPKRWGFLGKSWNSMVFSPKNRKNLVVISVRWWKSPFTAPFRGRPAGPPKTPGFFSWKKLKHFWMLWGI